MSSGIAAWLLTYLAHSTLLLGGVWLALQAMPKRLGAVAEPLWRLAMFGAVLTSAGETLLVPAQSSTAHIQVAFAAHAALPRAPDVVTVLVVAWGALAAIRVAMLVASHVRLRLRLQNRTRECRDRRVGASLTRAEGALVTVSFSDEIKAPFILGVRELCLPFRVRELTNEELDAVVAHELAHVARRDPFWLMLVSLVSRVLFVQPLNFVAEARQRELAELACDDRAVERTGDALALASALARVAEWIVGVRVPHVSVAMASRESLALARVRRLLGKGHSPAQERGAQVVSVSGTAVLAVLMLFGPAVSARSPSGARYTISAFDDAGPFTVTLDGGRVVALTVGGQPLPPSEVLQRGRHVHAIDRRGQALDILLTADGGMRWTSRPPVATYQ